MNFEDERLPPKYWAKLQPCPMTGCWLWTGAMNKNGYGSHGRPAPHSGSCLTHRYSFEHEFGALPPGTELDHKKCQTRSCANPHHMEPVPHRVNVQRGKAKKSHCVRGHELAGDNLMPCNRGKTKRCVKCVESAKEERNRAAREATRRRPPKPKRPRKTQGVCGRGHTMRFNGRRLICDTCARNRHTHGIRDGRSNSGPAPKVKAP